MLFSNICTYVMLSLACCQEGIKENGAAKKLSCTWTRSCRWCILEKLIIFVRARNGTRSEPCIWFRTLYIPFMRIQFFFPVSVQHVKRTVFSVVLLLLFCQPAWPATSRQPAITDILLSSSHKSLLLSATVQNCFTEDMLEGVHNAIPVTFRFYLDLRRVRNYWFNERIMKQVVNHTLSYDPIKQEYQVAFSEKDRPETTRSLEEAKKMMAELHEIKLLPLSKLLTTEKYALHIKTTLAENTLPLSIHSIIPLFSLWNFETDWRTVEFTY